MTTLYLSLGTNLGDRAANLDRACRLLARRVGALTARSANYTTVPEGFISDHLFLNAAVALATPLTPEAALSETQAIEREMGRTEKSRDGIYHDRSIDIDLLLYGQEVRQGGTLTLPHPLMTRRRFVLEPLCEIAPDVRHPVTGLTIRELLQRLDGDAGIKTETQARRPQETT